MRLDCNVIQDRCSNWAFWFLFLIPNSFCSYCYQSNSFFHHFYVLRFYFYFVLDFSYISTLSWVLIISITFSVFKQFICQKKKKKKRKITFLVSSKYNNYSNILYFRGFYDCYLISIYISFTISMNCRTTMIKLQLLKTKNRLSCWSWKTLNHCYNQTMRLKC